MGPDVLGDINANRFKFWESLYYLLYRRKSPSELVSVSLHRLISMSLRRVSLRMARMPLQGTRCLSSTARFRENERVHDNAHEHRDIQKNKPLNPHVTNTNSTISNEFPSLGRDKPPPDMLTSVDPDFTPKDSVPENTERMTNKTQKPAPDSGANKELGVGEMEGASFKAEPIRRTGEDANTMRARLLCPL